MLSRYTYTQISAESEEEIDVSRETVGTLSRSNIKLALGDINAKVGKTDNNVCYDFISLINYLLINMVLKVS